MRENLTPPKLSMKLSVKLSIDTHLLYGYSCVLDKLKFIFIYKLVREKEYESFGRAP